MKLYLLTRIGATGWDQYDAFVVRAKHEQEARQLAANDNTDEKETWLNKVNSECNELFKKGDPEVILSSFNAG